MKNKKERKKFWTSWNLLILSIIMIETLSSFNYSDEWKKVDSSWHKYPQTALQKIKEIESTAIREKNAPQQLRCILYEGAVSESFQNSSFENCLKALTRFHASTKDSVSASVSFYLIGQMYQNYLMNNDYGFSSLAGRTSLLDTVPEDVNEWSPNLFVDKIREYKLSALRNELLKTTEAKEFAPLLVEQDVRFRPTLFDLFVNDFVSNASYSGAGGVLLTKDEKLELLQRLVDFHANDKNRNAYVCAKINYLKRYFDVEDYSSYKFFKNDELIKRQSYCDSLLVLMSDEKNTDASMVARVCLCKTYYETIQSQIDERYRQDVNEEMEEEIYTRGKRTVAETISMNPKKIVEWVDDGAKAYPNHELVEKLRSLKKMVERPSFSIHPQKRHSTLISGETLKLRLRYANTDHITLYVYRYTGTQEQLNTERNHGPIGGKSRLERFEKVKALNFSLTSSNYFIPNDTILSIPPFDYGYYRIKTDRGKDVMVDFSVTDIFYLSKERTAKGTGSNFILTNAKTGAPQKDVEVRRYLLQDGKMLLQESKKTDEDGFSETLYDGKTKGSNFYLFKKGNDAEWTPFTTYVADYNYPINNSSDNSGDKISLMTDRAIYRPGQTIQFKAIAYVIKRDSSKTLAKKELKISLRNANSEEVSSINLTTNEFGSTSSSFVIPMGSLTGNYSILVNSQYVASVRVEEYKRPTFEVQLNKPQQTYSFSDIVSLKGNAQYYLGTPVSDCEVSYQVTRKPIWFWWFRQNFNEELVAEGKTKANENGVFKFSFKALPPQDGNEEMYMNYEVKAKVTDANGETQEQTISVEIGSKSMIIQSTLTDRILLNEFDKTNYNVSNLQGVGLQGKAIHYSICREEKKSIQEAPRQESYMLIEEGNVDTDEEGKFTLPLKMAEKKWKSGAYTIKLSTKDDQERVVEKTFKTVLYQTTDTKCPVYTELWTEDMGEHYVDYDEEWTVRVGTSLGKGYLLVTTSDEKRNETHRWVLLNDEIKTLKFSLKEDMGDEAQIDFFLVYNGDVQHTSLNLKKKAPKKDIPISLSVFRDNLQPGTDEQWTITVPAEKKTEVLAAMYDASLDVFAPLKWNFSPQYHKTVSFPSYIARSSIFYYGVQYWNENVDYSPWKISKDKWIGMVGGSGPMLAFRSVNGNVWRTPRNTKMYMAAGRVDGTVVTTECRAEDDALFSDAKVMMKSCAAAPALTNDKPVKVRTNFSETAFFFPQLQNEENGDVKISFRVPESLTRWNFRVLAHTKDLFYGTKEAQAVSQKEFMISTNLPRFLRKGDEIVLSSNVINLSEKEQKGVVKIQLLDPVTEKKIDEKIVPFVVNGKKNGAVEARFTVQRDRDAVIVRTIAQGNTFSDAEQKLLPILSDRMVLTQSMPLYVRGGGNKTFTMTNLANNRSKTIQNRFLKLDIVNNPIWCAVKAMPSIENVGCENAISYTSALFVTEMARHLMASNPKIKRVVDTWSQNSGDVNSLLSQLEKNTEVKEILLSETPWVMEAKDETERRRRLTTLFDLNTMQGKCDRWFNKLMEYKNEDGSYSWFKGMHKSRHVTLTVLDNFADLQKLNMTEADVLLRKADIRSTISYLDNTLTDDLKNLKKWSKNYKNDYKKDARISSEQLFYFYVRTLFPTYDVKMKDKEAYDFYMALMEKQWEEMSLFNKSLTAIVLYRGGKEEKAREIVRSLREYSVTDEENGMYWVKNENGYSWTERAIINHTILMEALSVVDPQVKEQDELKFWLLNQKRTQDWGDGLANIYAMKSLLLDGSNWIEGDNEVEVKMEGVEIQPTTEEKGTGAYTVYIQGDKVEPKMAKVELSSKAGGNISWGALYWQFEEEMSKVEKSKSALHVERMMMIETKEKNHVVLKKIDTKTMLRVGDKVVARITLRTDRDMDYVMLKDQRASCMEPTSQKSGYKCEDGVCFYQTPRDASQCYFFDHLPKGTYVFEYPLWITHKGKFNSGIATAQCLYAPEFKSNTEGLSIKVDTEAE